MSIFFLTTIQEKTFFALTQVPQSVTEIAKIAKIPRTSVAKALICLEGLGFTHGRKLKNKNKHVYVAATSNELVKK